MKKGIKQYRNNMMERELMNWKPNLDILPRTYIERYWKTVNLKEKLKYMEYRF